MMLSLGRERMCCAVERGRQKGAAEGRTRAWRSGMRVKFAHVESPDARWVGGIRVGGRWAGCRCWDG
eukprot:3359064-Rhodomonas_salina.1